MAARPNRWRLVTERLHLAYPTDPKPEAKSPLARIVLLEADVRDLRERVERLEHPPIP